MPTSKTKRKRNNRRSRSEYPALDPELNLKSRYEQIDYDYLDKLTDEEKKWLNNFTEEYINTSFNHDGERIHPKKYKTKTVKTTGKRKKIDVYKNEAENRNNARNRDLLTMAKTRGMTVELDALKDFSDIIESPEEEMIDDIDEKKKID